jgi:hypothetical protein
MLLAVVCGAAATGAAVRADDWIYTVRPGDTLWDLTRRHLNHMGYVERLQTANHVADPHLLPPGKRLRIPLRWARRRPSAATVVDTGGYCTVTPGGGPGPRTIRAGDQLAAGDSVHCAADSYATLEFEDGSQLRVQPDSQIRLEAAWVYGDAGFFENDVSLEQGRTENAVPANQPGRSRLHIRTPAATTSVRGTQFRVSTDHAHAGTSSEVERGTVGVAARRGSVEVAAGYGTFTHAGQAPAPPVPLLPPPDLAGLPALIERLPLRFELAPLPSAAGYRAGVAGAPAFKRLLAEFDADSTTLHGPDVPDGDYWLRVRGRDAQGIEGRDGVHPFTVNARPEPPFVLQPTVGGSTAITPVFEWTAHPQADHYEIEVARSPAFAEPLIAERHLRGTRFEAAGPLPPGAYWWRIATVSASEGRGPDSDAMPFRVPYPGPTAEPPALSRNTLTIQWARAAPGQTFQLQLARDEKFTDLWVDQAIEEPRIELPRPRAGRYFLRIRTVEADGLAGPFGTPQQIEVPHSRWWLLMLAPLLLLT